MLKQLSAIVIASTLMASGAAAKDEGKWPKGAKPLNSADVAAVFAGHTVNWSNGDIRYYFAPDKTLYGVHKTKGKEDGVATGTWSVRGNEFCFNSVWRGQDKAEDPFKFKWCNKLRVFENVVWAQDTAGEDQYRGNIHDGLTSNLKKGDQVSKKAKALLKRWGY